MMWLTESLATPEDRRHAERRRTTVGQEQSLSARALLRALLESCLAIPGRLWFMRTCDDGRIFAETDGLTGDLSVSLSHSRDRVACAISTDGPIGVDLEFCRHDRDVLAIAEYAFSDHEIAAVREAGASTFYQLWTMREAVAKASGAGLPETLQRCRIKTVPGSETLCAELDGRIFRLEHRHLPGGYALSLAVRADDD